jgi:ribonucleotide reductase alpha subunit
MRIEIAEKSSENTFIMECIFSSFRFLLFQLKETKKGGKSSKIVEKLAEMRWKKESICGKVG